MHVELHESHAKDPRARQAGDLISACVHCGFCLATCPTYLDTGDERDSPRGRIYLVKQLLEQGSASEITQTHLDRCLTCRSCETTCPSGMQYGKLVDIGRGLVEEHAPRKATSRLWRYSLRATLSRPLLFRLLLRTGQLFSPLLPPSLKNKIPPRQQPGPLPPATHSRRLLVLGGCVQSAATPTTNAAAARVLDRLGISLIEAPAAGCCGAVSYHLGAHDEGLNAMRRNIDAWWPHIESGAEAILSSATGCGSMIADYGELLADDPSYASKAARISELHRDLAQVLLEEDLAQIKPDAGSERVAIHTPCSQQHALQLSGSVHTILASAGFELAATMDDHLCCGSAGTYSILQPDASKRLRERKLAALKSESPSVIVTANVGCQLHLSEQAGVPVRHWIELLDPGPPG